MRTHDHRAGPHTLFRRTAALPELLLLREPRPHGRTIWAVGARPPLSSGDGALTALLVALRPVRWYRQPDSPSREQAEADTGHLAPVLRAHWPHSLVATTIMYCSVSVRSVACLAND